MWHPLEVVVVSFSPWKRLRSDYDCAFIALKVDERQREKGGER